MSFLYALVTIMYKTIAFLNNVLHGAVSVRQMRVNAVVNAVNAVKPLFLKIYLATVYDV